MMPHGRYDMDDHTLAQLHTKVDALLASHQRIEHILTGNGDPSKGIVVRFALVEDAHRSAKWWYRTAIGAGLAALATSVAAYFRHQSP